jgi:hypothetical protein
MRSYEVARTLFSFLAFCAWSIVVVGGLVALIGAGGGSRYGGAGAGLLAMVPGLSIGIAGLLLVAFVQIGRATVDTAEYSQQMLKVARDQLDVSKQGLKQQNAMPQSFSAAGKTGNSQRSEPSSSGQAGKTMATAPSHRTGEVDKIPAAESEYRGKTIKSHNGRFTCEAIHFHTLDAAKEYIDSSEAASARKLPGAFKP